MNQAAFVLCLVERIVGDQRFDDRCGVYEVFPECMVSDLRTVDQRANGQ